jgi:hypothetical protein
MYHLILLFSFKNCSAFFIVIDDMIERIEKGNVFLCTEALYLNYIAVAFEKGKVYYAPKDNTIENEVHIAGWDQDLLNKHFQLVEM